jgi:hypothetical protein
MRSCSTHTRATPSSSARVSTRPVGLCGELSTSIRAPGAAAASASRSSAKSGGRVVTSRRVAPASAIVAA